MQVDLLEYETKYHDLGYEYIAGTDEAGRGPLCGPVVAAAVILPKGYNLPGLTDSKKLSEKKREEFYPIIMRDAISVGVSIIDNNEIDRINILEASRKAMCDAISKLTVKPDFVLTDAMDIHTPNHLAIIKGDAKSLTIAAASVIATVTRDHIMEEYDKLYPKYEFAKHKGYPTKSHLEKIEMYGILDIYRKTYKPVQKIIERSRNESTQE